MLKGIDQAAIKPCIAAIVSMILVTESLALTLTYREIFPLSGYERYEITRKETQKSLEKFCLLNSSGSYEEKAEFLM